MRKLCKSLFANKHNRNISAISAKYIHYFINRRLSERHVRIALSKESHPFASIRYESAKWRYRYRSLTRTTYNNIFRTPRSANGISVIKRTRRSLMKQFYRATRISLAMQRHRRNGRSGRREEKREKKTDERSGKRVAVQRDDRAPTKPANWEVNRAGYAAVRARAAE